MATVATTSTTNTGTPMTFADLVRDDDGLVGFIADAFGSNRKRLFTVGELTQGEEKGVQQAELLTTQAHDQEVIDNDTKSLREASQRNGNNFAFNAPSLGAQAAPGSMKLGLLGIPLRA